MLTCTYIVERIDGDYAMLRREDDAEPNGEPKLVARALLPPEIVIHRLTGDGPKALLIAPLWSASKRLVLGSLDKRFRERCITQGCGCLDRNA